MNEDSTYVRYEQPGMANKQKKNRTSKNLQESHVQHNQRPYILIYLRARLLLI